MHASISSRLNFNRKKRIFSIVSHNTDVKSDWLKSAASLKGTVMNCLRFEYIKSQKSRTQLQQQEGLTGVCKDKLRLIIRESVLRFHLDPVLRQTCQADLLSHCRTEVCVVFF